MNLVGGYLNHYSDYSTCQITVGMPYLYGGGWVDGNSLSDMENSELAVFFGNNPSETRMSGCKAKTLQHARFTRNTRVIVIDPRYSDTVVSVGDEWIPIRPGTDAALSAALAYVMITEDRVDKAFLAKYTIGYDEASLPEGAPAGSSYASYILGHGPDKTPKTPAWASRITGIPPARIEKLAREIAGAKPCFICQGWGRSGPPTARTSSAPWACSPCLPATWASGAAIPARGKTPDTNCPWPCSRRWKTR